VIDPSNGRSMIGLHYHTPAAFYTLSIYDKKIEKEGWDIILSHCKGIDDEDFYKRLEKYNVPQYSGRALLSTIIPKGFYYNKKKVVIKDGILISGNVSGEFINRTRPGWVNEIYKQLG